MENDDLIFGKPDAAMIEIVVIAKGTPASGRGQVLARVTATGAYTWWNPNSNGDGTGSPCAVLADFGFPGRLEEDTPARVVVRGACSQHALLWPTRNIELIETGLSLLARQGLVRSHGLSTAVCGRSPF